MIFKSFLVCPSKPDDIAFLRLHGTSAKDHPVFRELTRVKQYFQKIEGVKSRDEGRTSKLDKAAANRFIKHALVSSKRETPYC